MLGIGEFFKRISALHAQEIGVRAELSRVIKVHTGADVPVESISFKGSTATLKNVPHALRTVIFIKKTAILADLSKSNLPRSVTEIR